MNGLGPTDRQLDPMNILSERGSVTVRHESVYARSGETLVRGLLDASVLSPVQESALRGAAEAPA